ncbi:barstar family protein [Actinoplanes regularis]|uniref:Barstar (Barnase inhibitor) n=1 Tax=Actinoplanes regularis TaxID=52697 RepID=A0A238YVH8_9ACTN|nr:barstar family protein [Actinoplanes regularis]GIE85591.1 hypothetical protein Are01nite_20710 [Actinoplanes regularis]SNR75060.1 Barstar (barnase inhibitor) [Actinoplanes regularis]
MAVFTEEEEEQGRIDWDVLHDGGIGAFQAAKALDGAIRSLRERGYGVAEVSGLASSARPVGAESHPAPADTLHQPAALLTDLLIQVSMRYCGWSAKNLDALCDTLRYIDFSGVTGWVLVLRDFDRLFEADARWAAGAIDVIAQVSREHLMRGHRLFALLHAEGQTVDLGKIGGFEVWWQ